MGIWDKVKTNFNNGYTEAHANRMVRDLLPALEEFDALQPNLKERTLIGFLHLRQQIADEMQNWTKDGAVGIAKQFHLTAKEMKDTNRAQSLANTLAALMLESASVRHPESDYVFETMTKFYECCQSDDCFDNLALLLKQVRTVAHLKTFLKGS